MQVRRGLQSLGIDGAGPADQQLRMLRLRGNDGKLEYSLGTLLSPRRRSGEGAA